MFRTELTIAPQERLLPRTARVLTVGSCFADSIGERLRLNKVNALVNPFGTVFQPLALAQLLRAAAGEEQDWQQHVVEARGRWQSYDFHSTVGAESPVELLQAIQERVRQVGEFVRAADAVVLTLGTAWAYRLRETGELVSNLHKLPASLFEKELLTADEIVNALAEVHALLRRVNPNISIVLTVSPVRHLKDTLQLNAVSKSVLRVACHYLSELLPNVSYFPAYELLTDDLRDYRFYAADMLHPSEAAEDYIWERFARAYFDADFGRFRKEWAAVRQSLGHRPLHIGAPEHRIFLDQTRERLELLTGQGVDVRQELRDVQRQLAALPPPRPVRVVEPEDDGEERIDIGDGTTNPVSGTSTTAQAAEADAQPNRRQDGRRDGRDGRRDGRNNRDRRDNRSAPVATPVVEELVVPTAEVAEESVAASVEALLAGPEAELLLPATEEAGAYPAKKKKRRSRGGAKRTARKNAARLAGEPGGEAVLEGEEDADDAETGTELAEIPAADTIFSEQLSPAELLTGASAASTDDSDFEPADNDQPEAEATQLLPDPEPLAAEQPRRRGTGPTPKKSKVITKSGLVKRGQRGNLYRTAAPTPEATGTPTLGTAPIISSPIIPEILLERPANNLASIQEPPTEPDLAATVLGLYVSKPKTAAAAAQPKRGRPKAAATAPAAVATEPAPDTNTDVAPTAASEATPALAEAAPAAETAPAVTDAPPEVVEAAPVATEAAPAAPAKATAKAKKPAASKKAAKPAAAKKTAAKPATPKKAAAKTAAPRRGRPPGKATASDAPDAPAA